MNADFGSHREVSTRFVACIYAEEHSDRGGGFPMRMMPSCARWRRELLICDQGTEITSADEVLRRADGVRFAVERLGFEPDRTQTES